MSFSIPLILCDTNTGANGIMYKEQVSPHCDLMNAMVPLTTALASQSYV